MRLKTSKGKKSLIRLFVFLCLRRKKQKSIYNGNVGFTKLVKVLSALCEQKPVYQNPVKKQNYLNDSGATKLVKACTPPMHTFTSLVAPAKKLNCLCEID